MRACEVYEVVVESQPKWRQSFSWLLNLAAGAVTLGAWDPSLDVERARIVRRRDGAVVGEVGSGLIHEAVDDLAVHSDEQFTARWIDPPPSVAAP